MVGKELLIHKGVGYVDIQKYYGGIDTVSKKTKQCSNILYADLFMLITAKNA